MEFNKKYYTAGFLVFLILLIGRLLIAGRGYLNDTDELLYLYIIQHHGKVGLIDIRPWVQAVFDMQGQPPEIIIRLFQSFFICIFSKITGSSMTSPGSLLIMGLFNIIVSLLILYIFFKILNRLRFSDIEALTGTFMLGTLVNMNIYTRHILPYDSALLFQFLALYFLLKEDFNYRHVLIAGIFSAVGLTNYFGYFMFVGIQIGFLLFNNYLSVGIFLRRLFTFLLPLVVLVSIYEILTRMYSGQSYLKFVLWYTDTINQGSFKEGLIYIFLYFGLVEKWWGIIVLFLFFCGIYLAYFSKDNRQAKTLLFIAVMAYLTYGSYVFFYEKMVFFGRVLHMYYAFVIIGVLFFIRQQKLIKPTILIGMLMLFALINYCFVIRDLNNIGYPRSIINSEGLYEQGNKVKFSYYNELYAGIEYKNRRQWDIDSLYPPALAQGKYTLVNFAFFKHHPDDFISTYKEYKMKNTDSLIFEKTHFQSHPIYTFEYCDKEGREFFLKKQFKIRVIKNIDY
jgi:hypothetical protein